MFISRVLVCASMLSSPVYFAQVDSARAFGEGRVFAGEKFQRHPTEPWQSADEIAAARRGYDDSPGGVRESSDEIGLEPTQATVAPKNSIFTRWAIRARHFEQRFKDRLKSRVAAVEAAAEAYEEKLEARLRPKEVANSVAAAGEPYEIEAQRATRDLLGPMDFPAAPVGSPAVVSMSDGQAFRVAPKGPIGIMFQLANSGGTNASLFYGLQLSGPFTFRGGKYPGIGGTCGRSLKPSATCTIVVAARPATRGEEEMLTMKYFDGDYTQTISRSVLAPAE